MSMSELNYMKNESTAGIEPPVSASKAAKRLGVSRPYLLKLAREGKIPALFLGRVTRFNVPEIMALAQRPGAQSGQRAQEHE